jgi:hypothetical protein
MDYAILPRRRLLPWNRTTFLIFVLVVAILALQALGVAFVHAATADDTTISAAPVYKLAEPYILEFLGLVWTAILGLALAWFKQKTNVQVDDAMIARINLAARNAAGRILASQEGNVSQLQFHVNNPWIAQEATKLMTVMGDEIKHLGWTPGYAAERLQQLVHAKVGVLQTGAAPSAPLPGTVG